MNKKFSTGTKFCVGLILVCLSWQIHSENVVCKRIRAIYISGNVEKYAVPFQQGGIDNVNHDFVYDLSFDREKTAGQLTADCGNGVEAECQMILNVKNAVPASFSLPTTIRLIKFEGAIYIVNGVTISQKSKVKFEDFLVNEISPNGIDQVCP